MGSLRFDRDQRYRTVFEILRRLGKTSGQRILDVGGGTGELRACLPECAVYSVDLLGGGKRHARASMDRIPFPDHSFHGALMMDALEHVPRDIRKQALSELARVASDWVVWMGPVEDAPTVETEELLCQRHRDLFHGREMAWLIEHREHGLPLEDETLDALIPFFEDWAWWKSCSLSHWSLYKQVEMEMDLGRSHAAFEAALNSWYAAEGWKTDYRIHGGQPAYRRIFVGARRGRLPFNLGDPVEPSAESDSWPYVRAILDAIRGGASFSGDGSPLTEAAERHLRALEAFLKTH